jgi:spheroidene monooxygenase
LLLVRWRAGSRLWGFGRLVRGPGVLAGTPGLRFARVLGSGHEGGFGLRPGWSHQGLMAFFDDEAAAAQYLDVSAVIDAYRRHADECLALLLRPLSVRGSWGGTTLRPAPAVAGAGPGAATTGPIASLTRASIRWHRAATFWARAPAAQAAVAAAPGCRLAIGLGEAPLLRQATFSLWDDAAALERYARAGAHRSASQAAWAAGWFSESMFVRFAPLRMQGRWNGVHHG